MLEMNGKQIRIYDIYIVVMVLERFIFHQLFAAISSILLMDHRSGAMPKMREIQTLMQPRKMASDFS